MIDQFQKGTVSKKTTGKLWSLSNWNPVCLLIRLADPVYTFIGSTEIFQVDKMIWFQRPAGPPITVNVRDLPSLLSELGDCLSRDQGFSVATINLDHVVKLHEDIVFQGAYEAHSHVTADGRPIVWLEHLVGRKSVSLVPGSELFLPLCRVAANKGAAVGLFGSTQHSLDLAARKIRADIPNIKIEFIFAPPMGFKANSTEADDVIANIDESGAKLIFIALGAPKQECFAARASAVLPNVGFVSIGAGIDFVSGLQIRAPKIVRAMAVEWLWRLATNPRRLAKRYLKCALIVPGLAFKALSLRLGTKKSPS